MHPECSPAVQRALEAAGTWAERLGSESVRAVHLLLALLEEEEGRPAVLLERHGLAPGGLRERLVEQLPPASAEPGNVVGSVLLRASNLGRRQLGDATVTTDYFLLALLAHDPVLGQGLRGLGLDVTGLERALLTETGEPIAAEDILRVAEPPEQIAAGRVLDASANRAREALRVLEDCCRFVLDDSFLTGEVKNLRHDLVAALDRLPPRLLLESRETLRDVGTAISAAGEGLRGSVGEVAQVNLKRLQEALRSLEEFGKIFGPDLGADLERLRYRAYTVERALVLGADSRKRLADARLYVLLTGSQCEAALDWTIAEAAAGGAQIFQLREKDLDDRALIERARQMRKWTRQAGALFIVNDRPDVARLAEADGVHLGQDDLSVKDARRILGPDGLIGVSTHNLEQVRQAVLDGANYIGVGPTFPSTTKDFSELAGLEFVKQALAETSLPAFVIGGVNLSTIGAAVATGAKWVAVSAAIAKTDDPRQAAILLRQALAEGGRQEF